MMNYSERRRHIGLRGALLLVLAPALTVLLVLALIEWFCRQQLLFALWLLQRLLQNKKRPVG